jgi:phosphoesterase RecJ-like protein
VRSPKIKGLKKAKRLIEEARTIVIASHINPDGDSIGSLLGLGLGLRKKFPKKTIDLLSRDGVPQRYRFLPGADTVMRHTDKKYDLAVSVDCSNKEILGNMYDVFKRAVNTLEIDHHEVRRPLGGAELIDIRAAAVGEMIYSLLKELNIRVDGRIAKNILTSVVVETNSFKLPGVRSFTFALCSELMGMVDFDELADRVYWAVTRQQAVLSGVCLSRCKFLKGGRIVWSLVKRSDFRKVKGKDEDVDAVAEIMRSIKNVRVVVLFREKENNMLRVSMRSKGKINVASVTEKFRGGGHYDIAGCYVKNDLKYIKRVLREAEKLLS